MNRDTATGLTPAEATQRAILDALPANVTLLDGEGRIVAVNGAWHRFGQENGLSGVEGSWNYLDVCDRASGPFSEEAPAAAAGIRAVLRGERDGFSLEYPCHSPDRRRWFLMTVTPVESMGAVVMHVDITERREAEDERRALMARERFDRKQADGLVRYYRSLFERAPGCFLVLTPDDFTMVAVSDAYLAATRTVREEILGRRLFEVFPDNPEEPLADGARNLRDSLERVKASGETDVMAVQRYPIRRPAAEGGGFEERFWSPVNCPVPSPEGALAYLIHRIEDVTEFIRLKQRSGEGAALRVTLETRAEQLEADIVLRGLEIKHAEEKHSQDQTLLRIAGRVAGLGGWIVSVPEMRITWSDETAAIHDEPRGFSPNISSAFEFYLPEHRDAIREAFGACVREGVSFDFEAEIATARGRRLWVRSTGEAVRDAEGKISHVQGALQDISERRVQHEKVREQATLLDKAQDAIMVRDLDHQVLYWNRGAERLYGWTAAEAMGQSARTLLYAEPTAFLAAAEALLTAGEWSGELEQMSRDRRALSVEGRWTLIRDERGAPKYVLSINTDITQRKRMEAQFMRVQRMESIGALAGGIAHDLNNSLSPVLILVSSLLEDERDPALREDLAIVQSCVQRSADMVRQLLTFARGGGGLKVRVDVAVVAAEVERIVHDTFPKNISFTLSAPRELWEVSADPTQIHQVLTNLCVNARDAMPDGGHLTVSIEHVVFDEVYAGMNLEARPGPYVMIRVEDSGAGIPRGILDHIFEPFFTTKEPGRGTGLGLSTAHAIVRNLGGFIHVYSEAGRGTRFKVYLPADVSATRAEATAVEHSRLPRGNNELLLVVDDEEAIRAVARRTLERYGYRVLLAANGAEAISLYVQHQHEIAVVLTDMAMPVMDGPATIVALKSLNPRVRIIGSSGLSANGHVAKAVGAGVHHFVPKPYTTETMLGTLKKILSEP